MVECTTLHLHHRILDWAGTSSIIWLSHSSLESKWFIILHLDSCSLLVHHYCSIPTMAARSTQVKGFSIRWFSNENTHAFSHFLYILLLCVGLNVWDYKIVTCNKKWKLIGKDEDFNRWVFFFCFKIPNFICLSFFWKKYYHFFKPFTFF